MDTAVENCHDFSAEEDASLYYVCGYIAHHLGVGVTCALIPQSCEFTDYLSRGKLSHPPEDLFLFSRMALALFKELNMDQQETRCVHRLSKLFALFLGALPLQVDSGWDVCRRLARVFFKGVTRKELVTIPPTRSLDERKLKKLQSK